MDYADKAIKIVRREGFFELIVRATAHFFPRITLIANTVLFHILLVLSAIMGRDETRLVFANVAQFDFSDNTKYLFLYMHEHHLGEVRPIWLTRDPELKTELSQKGYEVYLCNSRMGRLQLLRAGHVFFDGTMRSYKWPYTAGASKYQLRHGIPLKSAPKKKRESLSLYCGD